MSRVIWIRCEILDHAVFNTSIRWTESKVQEFLASLREAVPSREVTKAMWTAAATTRCTPALSENEAAAYWHVFVDGLQRPVANQANTNGIDFRVLGLLLMCQVFSPHRVRTDQFAKSGEGWPGLERATAALGTSSPRHSPRGTSPRVGLAAQSSQVRGRDASTAMLAFVRHQLSDFLQVACAVRGDENVQVTCEEFDLLGLILCPGVSTSQPLNRLSDAVPELAESRSLPLKELKRIVDKLLVWNDGLYASLDNSLGLPQAAPSTGTVSLTGMHKTTWFSRPPDSQIDVLSISCCHECTIYFTGFARFVFLADCHNCNIVLAGVSGLCTVNNCEKLTLHAVAHCFKVENTIGSAAYLYCHVPPILTGDTRGITLAPFNVLYSGLDGVLARAGLQMQRVFIDCWAHPICCTLGSPDETLGGRSGQFDHQEGNSTYHFVHPDSFLTTIVPEQSPQGEQSPLILPEVYERALSARQEEMRNFQRVFTELTDDRQKSRAMQAIKGHFSEWLHATGKSRQLTDLTKLGMK